MHNVTLRRVSESLLCWKRNTSIAHWPVCACVGARGYEGAWACACAYELIQHAARILHIVTSFLAPWSPPTFSTLSHKRCDFRRNVIERRMCILIFCTTFV